MDNWDYAAQAKEQSMIVFDNQEYKLIGPSLSMGAKTLIDFIIASGVVTTSKVAEEFDVSPHKSMPTSGVRKPFQRIV